MVDNNNNSENIGDETNFKSITIGEHDLNINRDTDDPILLNNFSDMIPKYNREYGIYLEISSKNSTKPKILSLNKLVTSFMLMPKDHDAMTDDEYYQTYVDLKTKVVEKLIKNTYALGYDRPSVVQALTILELIQLKDALVQFKSGTGKTHSFTGGTLWHFDFNDDSLQYIYITSSHEVAGQIYEHIRKLLPDARMVLCIGQKKINTSSSIGGFKTPISTSSLNNKPKSIQEEQAEVKSAQIIVCTMGKFYDYLFNRKWITNIKHLKAICVDEFDNIVASKSKRNSTIMTTEEQMSAIMKMIPKDAQRIFFSATVTEDALQIAHSYFRKPYHPKIGPPLIVLLNNEDYTLEGIRQYYVKVNSPQQKKEVLVDLIKQLRIAQAIIFVNNIKIAEETKNLLDGKDIQISSAIFHGSLPAVIRESIYNDFKNNKIRILISTDVASRGIDIPGINVIFVYDLPDELPTYIHRVGRSGRYGKKGVAISFVLCVGKINEMEKVYRIDGCSKTSKMEELPKNLANLL